MCLITFSDVVVYWHMRGILQWLLAWVSFMGIQARKYSDWVFWWWDNTWTSMILVGQVGLADAIMPGPLMSFSTSSLSSTAAWFRQTGGWEVPQHYWLGWRGCAVRRSSELVEEHCFVFLTRDIELTLSSAFAVPKTQIPMLFFGLVTRCWKRACRWDFGPSALRNLLSDSGIN
jgi:hypothetical protein